MTDKNKIPRPRWRVDMLESERGWGQKVDESFYFKTKEEADKYVKDYNEKHNNKSEVPDWYIKALTPMFEDD
jgi:hypothetical protein